MPNLRCPICRKDVPLDDPNAPFCSDRCRTIDLGRWASGDYKISTPIFDPDELESLQNAQSRAEHEAHHDSDSHAAAPTPPGSRWKN